MKKIKNWLLKILIPKGKMLVDTKEYLKPEILRLHNDKLSDKEWYIHMQLIKKDTIGDIVIYSDFDNARKWITYIKNRIKNN